MCGWVVVARGGTRLIDNRISPAAGYLILVAVIKENTRIDFTSVTTHRGRTTDEDVVEGTSHMLMGVGVGLNEVKCAQGDSLSN